MGAMCSGMSSEEVDQVKKSKEVDAANEAAFKKVSARTQKFSFRMFGI